MNLNTLKALDIWLKLYSAEELKLLELRCGETVISFEETLLARYENLVPKGSPHNFKANCAKIVVANRLWIYKIGEINSAAYELWMKSLKPLHFKRRTSVKFGFEKDQQSFRIATDKFEKFTKDYMKTRTGDSELGEEYDLEEEGEKKDLSLLGGAKLKKIPNLREKVRIAATTTQEGETKIYEDTFFIPEEKPGRNLKWSLTDSSTEPEEQEKSVDFLNPVTISDSSKEHGDNSNEKVVLKSASISSTVKGFKTDHNSDREIFNEAVSDTTGNRLVDNFSLQEIVHEYQKFDSIDVMERYLQKFDCLFSKECQ